MQKLSDPGRAPFISRDFLLGIIFFSCLPLSALAQTQLTQSSFSPIVTVSPQVADAGITRTITVRGAWTDSCIPTNPVLSSGTLPGLSHLNVRFEVPQSPVVCFSAVREYSATLTYTPTQAGTQGIAITLSDGRYLGGGMLITQAVGQPRGSLDLSGAWFDQASAGSGLALFHSQATSDVTVGAWYVFDGSGKPFWYLIQNGRWQASTIYVADLKEVQANTAQCNALLPACARAQSASRTVADISIQIVSEDRIPVRVTEKPNGKTSPPIPVVLAEFEASRIGF